jgi:hypothetical protein
MDASLLTQTMQPFTSASTTRASSQRYEQHWLLDVIKYDEPRSTISPLVRFPLLCNAPNRPDAIASPYTAFRWCKGFAVSPRPDARNVVGVGEAGRGAQWLYRSCRSLALPSRLYGLGSQKRAEGYSRYSDRKWVWSRLAGRVSGVMLSVQVDDERPK